ncbi:hypothetical protein GMMP15_780008 [Candidatus Magnetomoraceae bacterium gMMP-15]
MNTDHARIPPYEFASRLAWLGTRLLMIYIMLYGIELFFQYQLNFHLNASYLNNCEFNFWQLIFYPFINNFQFSISLLINCTIFYFFAAPVENVFGLKRVMVFFYTFVPGGLFCGSCSRRVSTITN